MNTADLDLLLLISSALFNTGTSLNLKNSPGTTLRESVAQSVTALAYEAAKKAAVASGQPLPPEVDRAWNDAVNSIMRRNIRVEAEHGELHRLMTSAGIPYVILKGCASAAYYPDPFLRTLGDVDFLVRPEDADRADKLLRENGFTYKPSSNTDERVYVRGKSVWELHTAANGTPGGEVGKRVRALMADAIEKAEPVSYVGVEFHSDPNESCRPRRFQANDLKDCSSQQSEKTTVIPNEVRNLTEGSKNERDPSPAAQDDNEDYLVPSDFHHGLILLLHTARHMTTGGIGLRHLCDWAVFAAYMGDRFPAEFEDKLKSVGLWKFACILTQLSSEYLGAPEQAWAGQPDAQDRELLEALMDDIFAGGNFGVKDKSRRDQAKFITDRKSGGAASRSMLGQAVRSANEIVRRHWPAADKLPFLYPFGWAFFGGRYAIHAAFGRRERLAVRSLSHSANRRRGLYGQLELFKDDRQ